MRVVARLPKNFLYIQTKYELNTFTNLINIFSVSHKLNSPFYLFITFIGTYENRMFTIV
jgi:hypothetical protein